MTQRPTGQLDLRYPPPFNAQARHHSAAFVVLNPHFSERNQTRKVFPMHFVAFHPRPQIASGLGRNVTRSPNPLGNRADSNRNRPQPAAI